MWFDAGELEKYAAIRNPTARSAAEVQPESDGLQLECPKCARATLGRVRALGVTAWHCSDCMGLSLEPDALAALARRGSPADSASYPRVEVTLDLPDLGEAGSIVMEAVLDLLSGFFSP